MVKAIPEYPAIKASVCHKKFISRGKYYSVVDRKGLFITVIDNFGLERKVPITLFLN